MNLNISYSKLIIQVRCIKNHQKYAKLMQLFTDIKKTKGRKEVLGNRSNFINLHRLCPGVFQYYLSSDLYNY